jgi:hypothetical protein
MTDRARRRLLAAAAIALCLVAAAGRPTQAAEQTLKGPEIQALLAGNSVHGTWGSTEYWSYFDADGSTLYRTSRGIDRGQWRVKGDQYCSVWPQSGESCYGLARDGDRLIWLTSEGKRYPSDVIAGKAAGF